jgi:hypothetical protein
LLADRGCSRTSDRLSSTYMLVLSSSSADFSRGLSWYMSLFFLICSWLQKNLIQRSCLNLLYVWSEYSFAQNIDEIKFLFSLDDTRTCETPSKYILQPSTEWLQDFSDLLTLDRVLECGVDDIFRRDYLPFWDDLLHYSQEGDHKRVRFHLL